MRYEPPSAPDTAALVQAALRFRDAAPWQHITPDRWFAVRDPATGHLAYIQVHGHEGITPGLAVHPGAPGFRTMLEVLHGAIERIDDRALLRLCALTCGFHPRREHTRDDRAFLARSGIAFGARELAPVFVSCVPGFLSWRFDAAETRLFTTALEQSLIVVEDLRRDPVLLEAPEPLTVLTRRASSGAGGLEWRYEWSPLEPDFAARVKPWRPDDLLAARLARLPVEERQEWEFDAVPGLFVPWIGALRPGPSHRPELLRAALLVDRGSGYIHWGEPFPASELEDSLGRRLAETVLRIGYRPRRMLVRDLSMRDLLAPIARAMGCRLHRVRFLPAVDEVYADMVRAGAGPGSPSPDG